eukprot:CAMPEP_0115594604 /NCGR_PEP_ID=MMETSP0272-20121206/11892_1 /TAXON_ID=71861 /ORGANISM="Scrippsiella trochoidea, Strain CCMP3099" /LENGTH=118 /DNA_ID=CAMNT_0003029889 /DNA_START=197 /DNA_END=553 /DNA_ORIENTATION=+
MSLCSQTAVVQGYQETLPICSSSPSNEALPYQPEGAQGLKLFGLSLGEADQPTLPALPTSTSPNMDCARQVEESVCLSVQPSQMLRHTLCLDVKLLDGSTLKHQQMEVPCEEATGYNV